MSVLAKLYSTTNDNQPQCHVLTESWNVQLWFRLKVSEMSFKCGKEESPASVQHSQKEEASGCSHGHQKHSSKDKRQQGYQCLTPKQLKNEAQKTTATTYTLGLIDPQFKTTADHVYAEANQTVQHACRNTSPSFNLFKFDVFLLANILSIYQLLRKCLLWCHRAAPGTATRACAAQSPSPSASWYHIS